MRHLTFYLALAFVVLLGAAPARAQGGPPPPPPPAPDYFPERWKEYVYEVDNLRFRFPAEPQVETESMKESFGTRTMRIYSHQSFVLMKLMVYEYPPGRADFEAMEAERGFLGQMVQLGLDKVKDENPKVIKQSDITVDGHAGKFVHVETGTGRSIRYQVFFVKNRMYASYAEVRKGERHGHNFENDFEKVVMGFMDSIRLVAPGK